jgi:hypothetical protein
MSLTASAINNPHESSATRGAAVPVALLGLIALAPMLLSYSRINWVETWTAAGILGLIALYFALQRKLSATVSGVTLTILFAAVLINFSPLSLRGTLQKGWTGSSSMRWVALGLPLFCAVLMSILSIQQHAAASSAANFLSSLSIRLNLWLVACLAALGGLLLGARADSRGCGVRAETCSGCRTEPDGFARFTRSDGCAAGGEYDRRCARV